MKSKIYIKQIYFKQIGFIRRAFIFASAILSLLVSYAHAEKLSDQIRVMDLQSGRYSGTAGTVALYSPELSKVDIISLSSSYESSTGIVVTPAKLNYSIPLVLERGDQFILPFLRSSSQQHPSYYVLNVNRELVLVNGAYKFKSASPDGHQEEWPLERKSLMVKLEKTDKVVSVLNSGSLVVLDESKNKLFVIVPGYTFETSTGTSEVQKQKRVEFSAQPEASDVVLQILANTKGTGNFSLSEVFVKDARGELVLITSDSLGSPYVIPGKRTPLKVKLNSGDEVVQVVPANIQDKTYSSVVVSVVVKDADNNLVLLKSLDLVDPDRAGQTERRILLTQEQLSSLNCQTILSK